MKKVSTVARKQSRNFSGSQKLTVGLDLGDRNSWYCVLDPAGEVRLEQRMRTTANAVIAVGINWQLARARPGRVGWRRGPYY